MHCGRVPRKEQEIANIISPKRNVSTLRRYPSREREERTQSMGHQRCNQQIPRGWWGTSHRIERAKRNLQWPGQQSKTSSTYVSRGEHVWIGASADTLQKKMIKEYHFCEAYPVPETGCWDGLWRSAPYATNACPAPWWYHSEWRWKLRELNIW
jgi:hypothetical protein